MKTEEGGHETLQQSHWILSCAGEEVHISLYCCMQASGQLYGLEIQKSFCGNKILKKCLLPQQNRVARWLLKITQNKCYSK